MAFGWKIASNSKTSPHENRIRAKPGQGSVETPQMKKGQGGPISGSKKWIFIRMDLAGCMPELFPDPRGTGTVVASRFEELLIWQAGGLIWILEIALSGVPAGVPSLSQFSPAKNALKRRVTESVPFLCRGREIVNSIRETADKLRQRFRSGSSRYVRRCGSQASARLGAGGYSV